MKKFLLPVLITLITAFSFIACEGPMGPQGEPGKDGYGFYREVYDNVVVRSSEWELVTDADGSNPRFVCEKYFDELDDYILQYGSTETYKYRDPNNIDAGLVSLTDSYPVEDGVLGPTWTEFYSAIYFPGSIIFVVRYSDFNEEDVPPTCKFKVIFTWD